MQPGDSRPVWSAHQVYAPKRFHCSVSKHLYALFCCCPWNFKDQSFLCVLLVHLSSDMHTWNCILVCYAELRVLVNRMNVSRFLSSRCILSELQWKHDEIAVPLVTRNTRNICSHCHLLTCLILTKSVIKSCASSAKPNPLLWTHPCWILVFWDTLCFSYSGL